MRHPALSRSRPIARSLGALLLTAAATSASAEEMSRGELAAAIRSAGHPCVRVVAMQASGSNAWAVQCNSGGFSVRRLADGKFAVSPAG